MAVSRNTTASWTAALDAGNFPLWAQAIEDAIVGAGCVVVDDSGDTVPSSMVLPGANDTSAGYRIYRFPDSDPEQASNPVYFKIIYLQGDSQAELRVHLQAGKGSNGAGTLTSATGQITSNTSGGSDGSDRLIHASLIDGELVLMLSPSVAGNATWMILSRCKDLDGEFNGRIVSILNMHGSLSGGYEKWTGSAWTGITASGVAPMPGVSADGVDLVAGIYPSGEPLPLRGVMIGAWSGIANLDAGNVDVGGELRAMIASGLSSQIAPILPSASSAGFGGSPPGTARTLLRNE